jgi:Fe-S cluster biogenesis protein NfuA
MSNVTSAITPNPDARIFLADRTLIRSNRYVEVISEAGVGDGLPTLCVELIKLGYVRRVFIMNNFVTVVKAADTKWNDVLVELCRTIEEYLPEFNDAGDEDSPQAEDEGSAIKQVLDSYVAPAIAVDGGAIRYHSFDKASGILTVDVLGSCHGCPSLVNTLKRGIEPMIMDLFPQVTAVVRLKK